MSPVYREVVTAPEDTPVVELAERMHENEVGCVVITRENRAVGMVTDRDLAVKIPPDHDRWDQLRARDVMTKPVVHARPRSTATEIITVMREKGVRRVPILDDDDRVVEIVSLDDFFSLLVGELDELEGVLERYRPTR